MNRTTTAIIILFVLNGFLIGYHFLHKPEGRIVYIDNIKVFNGFNFKKEREAAYEKQKAVYQGKLDTLRLHYTAIENALGQTGGQSLERQLAATANRYQETEAVFLHRLDSMDNRFNDEIWSKINTYLQDFGKEKSYDLIIGATGTGNLMYANENFDVTQEAIDYINLKYEGE